MSAKMHADIPSWGEGQCQVHTIEWFDAKQTFDKPVAILNVHFQPEANAMVQWQIFCMHVQQAGKTHKEFLVAL